MDRRLVCLLLFAPLLSACAAPAPPVNDPADLAAVTTLRDSFQKAFNAADANAVGGLYTPDAISMGNHQPSATGRDAIVASHKALFDQMSATSIELTSEETQTMGTFGFDRGRYKMTMTPKAGGPATSDEGRYIVLLQKGSDGAWRVSRDIDNSTLPMPAPPSPPAPAKGKGKGQ